MSATMTEAEMEAYTMPRPARGLAVLWFPHASKTETPEIGYVRDLGKRSLTLSVNGVAFAPVRHITDPKLSLNAYQRENGAWDFCDDHLQNVSVRLDDLTARIEQLEKQLVAVENRGKNK